MSRPAAAQVVVQVVSGTKTAAPGDFVTHVFSVENQGADDVFDLSVTLSPGLILLTPLDSLTLAHGEQGTVFITVQVTAQAAAGENHVRLTVQSQSDPSISGSATAIIDVLPREAVEVLPPAAQQADPGAQLQLKFTVKNEGNVPDRFRLTVSSRAGFPVTVTPQELELLPSESGEAVVRLRVPEDAAPGRDLVVLKAVSLENPQVTAEASVTITILPPPPQAVTGPLYPLLPATLTVELDGALLEQEYSLPLLLRANGPIQRQQLLDLEFSVADLLNLSRPQLTIGWGNSTNWCEFSSGQGWFNLDYLTQPNSTTEAEAGFRRYWTTPKRSLLSLRWSQGLEALSLLLKLQISSEEERLDSAFQAEMGCDLDAANFKLRLELLGPSLGDRAGLGLYSRIRAADFFSALLFFGYHSDNVAREPAISTVTTIETLADGSLDFGEELPSVRLRGQSTRRVSDGSNPNVNQADWSLFFSLLQPVGQASLYLSIETARELDWVAGTEYEDRDYEERLSLNLSEALLILRFTQSSRYDLLTGMNISSTYGLELESDFSRSQLGLLIGGMLSDETLEFNVKITRFSRTLDLALAAKTTIAAGTVGLSFTIQGTTRFDLPLPLIKTKGRVEGYLFIDDNGNGQRDPGEPGVSDVILKLDDIEVRSDGEHTGFFRFPPLWPGHYKLEIENLPAGLGTRVPLPIEFELRAGQVLEIDIPLTRVATIRGHVFNDENRDGKRESDEPGLPGVHLLLSGAEQRDTYTDIDGSYAFTDLLPGAYTISVDENSLPERFELTTPKTVELRLQPEETVTVDFGAAERKRKIIITTGIPVAEFTWSPEHPRVGDSVTFDASASEDPDGTIVKYEWDFNSDGEPDATGMVVSRIFGAPGDYPVTLTVTDNDGNTDSITKVVTVSP